jgi:hypothetical protein
LLVVGVIAIVAMAIVFRVGKLRDIVTGGGAA